MLFFLNILWHFHSEIQTS